MLLTVLRFNFASPQGDPRTQSRLFSAALELAQWGESKGITSVSVDEHHATGHGWSCNPIMAASMFVGGGVRATARRAVRFGLPLSLVDHLPDSDAYYRELCVERGIAPIVLMPGCARSTRSGRRGGTAF